MSSFVRISMFVLLLGAVAFAQESLGDVARRQRVDKKTPAKVITNDDLTESTTFNNGAARTGSPSTEGDSDKSGKTAKSSKADKISDGDKNPNGNEKEAALTSDDAKKPDAAYRDRYLGQKKSLDLLNRELNVLEREYQIQTAEFYADAASRLRSDKEWAEKRKKYEDDIAAKRKQVEEAKQKMEDLKEEARHAGVSSSVFVD